MTEVLNPSAILTPMLTLVGWTLCVLLLIPYRRLRAAAARRVTVGDFRYGESTNVPGDVCLPNRNMMNLLELPLLFYVCCLTLFVTLSVDTTAVTLAWAYVGLRVAHSVVHVSYNNVLHRLGVFAASNAVLLVLWLRLFLSLSGD